MMRPKSLLLLGLALGCGLVASIGISQVLDSKNQAVVDTVPIYVAIQNINLGDPIDDGMVSLEEWPKGKVPVGAIAKWEDLENRRPRSVIFQGEPILDGKLLAKGQSHDPIAGIPPGMRLKTVSVNAQKSAAGLLSPGDRVDVQIFVERNERANITRSFTKIILQNIRVFAVDQVVQRTSDGTEARTVAKTVSLVLTPQQANRVTTAENFGEISLIPRNPDDDVIVDDWEQSVDDIFARSDASSREQEQTSKDEEEDTVAGIVQDVIAQVVPAEEPPFTMKLIFPGEVQELQFSAETGEPINTEEQAPTGYSTGDTVGASVGDTPAQGSGTFEGSADDFPIDLQQE